MHIVIRPVLKLAAAVNAAALLALPLPSFASAANQWTCISSHGCVATTPCTEKQISHSISHNGEKVVFTSAESRFDLKALKPSDGAILRAYGQPIAAQGVSSLTLFDDLTFAYSIHVSVEMNPDTGQHMGLVASVLGTCETVVS